MTQSIMAAVAAILIATVSGQMSSAATVSSSVPTPSVASGYSVQLVASGLEKPRGIIFDSQDHLLTVQQGLGVVAYVLQDAGDNTVSVSSHRTVIADTTVSTSPVETPMS